MGGASDEPGPHTLPQPLGENSRGGSGEENVSALETDLLLVFEEQEESSPAPAPGSLRPHRLSVEPSRLQIDQEHGQGGIDNVRSVMLGHGSLLRGQDYGEELQEQQRQEVAEEAMREDDDDNDDKEPKQQGEKRWRLAKTKVGGDIHHPKASERRHDTNDEDDEDPRPAKRRKLPPAPTDNALTPISQHLWITTIAMLRELLEVPLLRWSRHQL